MLKVGMITGYRWSPPQAQAPSTNVAQAYARFARDYREGTHFCPTFGDAVTRHRMLEAIETAAATGRRQTPRLPPSVSPWEQGPAGTAP